MSTETSLAITRLNNAWESFHIWDILHEVSPIVKENPEAFYSFIGKEIPLRFCKFKMDDGVTYKVRLVDFLTYTKTGTNEKATFTFESINTVNQYDKNSEYARSAKLFDPMTILSYMGKNFTMLVSPSTLVAAIDMTSVNKYIPKIAFPSYTYGGINPTTVDAYEARPSVVELFGEAVATDPSKGYNNQAWGKSGKQFKFYADHPEAAHKKKTGKTNGTYWLRDVSGNAANTGYRAYVNSNGELSNLTINNDTALKISETFVFCVD